MKVKKLFIKKIINSFSDIKEIDNEYREIKSITCFNFGDIIIRTIDNPNENKWFCFRHSDNLYLKNNRKWNSEQLQEEKD